jgi:biopolymer transport protein ExbD
MPPKILFRLGLAFFMMAIAAYFCADRWLASRIFTPLNDSVSLDSRYLKSQPFKINLSETYFVSLDLDYSLDDWQQGHPCDSKAIENSSWRVYRFGPPAQQSRELWANSEELTHSGDFISYAFLAHSGKYQLEWDIPAAAPCLNSRHPRLSVSTSPYGYREGAGLTKMLCLFLGGTGLALLGIAGENIARLKFAPILPPRIFPGMVLRNVIPIVKHAPLRPIHALPHWPLFWGAVVSNVMFAFMILRPLPYQGLAVSWKSQDSIPLEKSPWPDTLGVYVRSPSRFLINGQEVSRRDLQARLTEQLNHRVEWTVYFEAEPDADYMDALYAIEKIQACGAKLIWITPRMREEWGKKLGGPAPPDK